MFRVVEMLLKEIKGCQRLVHTTENTELLLPNAEGNRKEVREVLVHDFGCAHFKKGRHGHCRCGSVPIFFGLP